MLNDLTHAEIALLAYLIQSNINLADDEFDFDIPFGHYHGAHELLRRRLIGSVSTYMRGSYVVHCTKNQFMPAELEQKLYEYEIIWRLTN